MSTTLTNLIPNVYTAIDVVSRELTGMIPSVTLDAKASAAAVNQSVYVPVAPTSNSLVANTAAMTVPTPTAQTIGATEVKITKSYHVPFEWNGEDELSVDNGGPGAAGIQQNQIVQAIRTLTNQVENDLTALYATTSRAAGTAGTTPFASTMDGANQARKILIDNGAGGDLQLVIDTAAGAKLRNLAGLQVGKDGMVLSEQGILYRNGDQSIRESAQIYTPTAGTGASATTNATGYAIGDTVITLAAAGTGSILAGDVITFNGDTNQYVVASGDADVVGGGTITLAAPGLRKAIAASATAITVVAAAARNMAFARSAIVLAARPPAIPKQGDLAIDRTYITDPRTGLTFELSVYPGFRQVIYHIGLAWGVKNIKPAHTALLLG